MHQSHSWWRAAGLKPLVKPRITWRNGRKARHSTNSIKDSSIHFTHMCNYSTSSFPLFPLYFSKWILFLVPCVWKTVSWGVGLPVCSLCTTNTALSPPLSCYTRHPPEPCRALGITLAHKHFSILSRLALLQMCGKVEVRSDLQVDMKEHISFILWPFSIFFPLHETCLCLLCQAAVIEILKSFILTHGIPLEKENLIYWCECCIERKCIYSLNMKY